MIISYLDLWHMWMYSKDHARQSCIFLDFINPYWFLLMTGMMMSWTLFASSLVRILIVMLTRETGL